jgi:hypothetical protein
MSDDITEIDERARQMSDDERDAYLTDHGWQNVGVGWFPPGASAIQTEPDPDIIGIVIRPGGGGLYSRSSAIREQLAREHPDAVPNELGRYYQGDEPADSIGKRW